MRNDSIRLTGYNIDKIIVINYDLFLFIRCEMDLIMDAAAIPNQYNPLVCLPAPVVNATVDFCGGRDLTSLAQVTRGGRAIIDAQRDAPWQARVTRDFGAQSAPLAGQTWKQLYVELSNHQLASRQVLKEYNASRAADKCGLVLVVVTSVAMAILGALLARCDQVPLGYTLMGGAYLLWPIGIFYFIGKT